VNESSLIFEPVASCEQLENYILFLNSDDGTGGDPRMGNEIEFLERNSFDSALIFRYYQGWVNSPKSPLALRDPDGSLSDQGRDAHYKRMLGLQLRDYYRQKWGFTPLSEQQKRDWNTDPSPLLNAHRTEYYPIWNDQTLPNRLTDAEIADAAHYMINHYPGVAHYFQTVRSLAETQGYTEYEKVGRTHLINDCIDDSIRATINHPLGMGGQWFQVQQALLASSLSDQL
jgi:hypothetical protein